MALEPVSPPQARALVPPPQAVAPLSSPQAHRQPFRPDRPRRSRPTLVLQAPRRLHLHLKGPRPRRKPRAPRREDRWGVCARRAVQETLRRTRTVRRCPPPPRFVRRLPLSPAVQRLLFKRELRRPRSKGALRPRRGACHRGARLLRRWLGWARGRQAPHLCRRTRLPVTFPRCAPAAPRQPVPPRAPPPHHDLR